MIILICIKQHIWSSNLWKSEATLRLIWKNPLLIKKARVPNCLEKNIAEKEEEHKGILGSLNLLLHTLTGVQRRALGLHHWSMMELFIKIINGNPVDRSMFNPLMPGGLKRSLTLKENFSWKQRKQQNNVWNQFKVNNRSTTTTSLTSLYCLYC